MIRWILMCLLRHAKNQCTTYCVYQHRIFAALENESEVMSFANIVNMIIVLEARKSRSEAWRKSACNLRGEMKWRWFEAFTCDYSWAAVSQLSQSPCATWNYVWCKSHRKWRKITSSTCSRVGMKKFACPNTKWYASIACWAFHRNTQKSPQLHLSRPKVTAKVTPAAKVTAHRWKVTVPTREISIYENHGLYFTLTFESTAWCCARRINIYRKVSSNRWKVMPTTRELSISEAAADFRACRVSI